MKKLAVFLLVIAMFTTVSLAAEEVVEYDGVAYTYGGQAVETADDNGNDLIDGILLRGVEENTYYSAGDGFVYFIPASEGAPATITLDNATIVADYGIQAVSDLDIILVGENTMVAEYANAFLINAVNAYDENMEVQDVEAWEFHTVTIDGEGSLDMTTASAYGIVVGQLAIHGGDISITAQAGSEVAIEACCDYIPDAEAAFLMDGGALSIDLGETTPFGICTYSGDILISGGTLDITGDAEEGCGILANVGTSDVTFAVTGGNVTIDTNSVISAGTYNENPAYTATLLIDFAAAPEGSFQVSGAVQFCDTAEIYAEAGTVSISVLDGVYVESEPVLVTTLSDYLYGVNYNTLDEDGNLVLQAYEAYFAGNPEIAETIRRDLTFPYALEVDVATSYTFTRGQVIALLWEAMGRPEATIDNPFTDVALGYTYYDAIVWAAEMGITSGTTATTFAPDTLCNKAHLITFLYHNAGTPEMADIENLFADVTEEDYFYDAVLWGIANTMTDLESDTFDATSTALVDATIAYLLCML